MNSRGLIALCVLSLLMALVFLKAHETKTVAPPVNTNKQVTTPCASDATPCIEITLEGGQTYKLNDFRFLPNQCIDFISLPDKQPHNWCSKYQMKWIGPDTTGSQKT